MRYACHLAVADETLIWRAFNPVAETTLREIATLSGMATGEGSGNAKTVELHLNSGECGGRERSAVAVSRFCPREDFRWRFNPDGRQQWYSLSSGALATRWRRLALRRTLLYHAFLPGTLSGMLLPVHGALAEWQGRGVLFCGESGAGKSTLSQRLPLPWRSCSDDAALLELRGDCWWVRPLPTWSFEFTGLAPKASWQVQKALPLAGIFLLVQESRDAVRPLTAQQQLLGAIPVVTELWRQIEPLPEGVRRELFETTMTSARKLAARLPILRLDATRDGACWLEVESWLSG